MRKIRNSVALVLIAGSMLVAGAGTAAASDDENVAFASNVCHNQSNEGILNILNNVDANVAILGTVEDNDPCVSTAIVDDEDNDKGKKDKGKKGKHDHKEKNNKGKHDHGDDK
ncbi:hypothetical protein C3Y87_00490 [Carbonactinospora thermoautotrophica]|uniref:hypothetical protein n=1 Tax=Carbonactinospora thermoautotrophica TaxID=1469144 RepID=UPI00226D7DED|nr:hypothetical protein [Carbonactinospora thermoautotrophica]MCX9189922.1 hypothetical protein [Carbonactinospora thermoautotrophica]